MEVGSRNAHLDGAMRQNTGRPYDCWVWRWPVIRYATVRGL